MSLVDLQSPQPGMVYDTTGSPKTWHADQNGVISGVPVGSQAFRDLLNAGCTMLPTTQSGTTPERPTNPRIMQAFHDTTLGRTIVWDGAGAWRDLGEPV